MRTELERTHARLARSLRQTARRALHAAAVAQAVTAPLSSCTPRSAVERDGAPVCDAPDGRPFRASRLTPGVPVDYLAIRQTYEQPPTGTDAPPRAPQWTRTEFVVESEVGRPCATAHDAQCRARIAKHPDQPSNKHCVQACSETSVVVSRGDEVTRHATVEELSTLLAPIDTPDEAALLVHARHYTTACAGDYGVHVSQNAGGFRVRARRMTSTCPVINVVDEIDVTRDGSVKVVSSGKPEETQVCIGRMTAGLARAASAHCPGPPIAQHLAACAELEACAVLAFDRLIRELTHHGAPALLIRLATRARADEVRHAREVGELARAYGGEPAEAPRARVSSPRSLREIAEENAVEGYVRETYGALVGAFQAKYARAPSIRALMKRLARDELRHATLSHLVHAWLLTMLDEKDRAAVEHGMVAARAALHEESRRAPEAALARALGLPSQAEAQALLRTLEAA